MIKEYKQLAIEQIDVLKYLFYYEKLLLFDENGDNKIYTFI